MTAEVAAPVRPGAATEAGSGEGRAPRGLRQALGRAARTDAARCGLLALGWQVVLTLFGALIERPLAPLQTFSRAPAPPPFSLLSHTYRFDATWIAGILEGSYGTRPQSAAFYPLFPLLVRAVELASFGTLGLLAAGLVVNTLALWAALHALLRVAGAFAGDHGRVALVVLLAAPTAYYLHVFYSEAVFLGLAFTAYRFALERRWTPMGLCLVPLTASRVTAILVVGLCFLEFWRAGHWRPGALLRPAVLWFPVAFAGLASYALALRAITGDAVGMFTAYRIEPSWAYTQLEPDIPLTLARAVRISARAAVGEEPFTNVVLVDQILPLLGLAVLLATSTYLLVALRGRGVPLGVYGYATAVMITLNGNLVAVHRYLLPSLGLYVALAVLVARGGRRAAARRRAHLRRPTPAGGAPRDVHVEHVGRVITGRVIRGGRSACRLAPTRPTRRRVATIRTLPLV